MPLAVDPFVLGPFRSNCYVVRTERGAPEAAVIDTGSLKVVYRETLPNTFEGVAVKLGAKMRDPDGSPFYPILAGLN